MSAVALPGVRPGYRHETKEIVPGPLLSLGDRATLKWWDIAPESTPVPAGIRELARHALTEACAAGKLDLAGVGFVILHRCGEAFYFLLVTAWAGDNELWETVWAKDGDGDVVVSAVAGRGQPPPDLLRLGARRGLAGAAGMEPLPAVDARRRRLAGLSRGRPPRNRLSSRARPTRSATRPTSTARAARCEVG